MARFDKFKHGSVGNLGKHFAREKNSKGEEVKYKNQEIRSEFSHLNYNLAPDHKITHAEIIKKRLNEINYLVKRSDLNVMCSWIVTLPKTIEKDSNEEKLFFEKTYEFLKNRYDEKNVISAYVHKDETQPHIHFAFIPIIKDKKKNIYKVSAKELINRQELSTFHKDLSNYLEKYFDRDVGILNEETKKGNKSIDELKRNTAVDKLEQLHSLMKKNVEKLKLVMSKIVTLEEEYKNNLVKKEEFTKEFDTIHRKKEKLETTIIQLEKELLEYNVKNEDIDKIKAVKTIANNIKNVSIDEIENLKKLAKKANLLETENTKLKNENEQLKIDLSKNKKSIDEIRNEIDKNKQLELLKLYIQKTNQVDNFNKFIDIVKNKNINKNKNFER